MTTTDSHVDRGAAFDLQALLNPGSVAVVGANDKQESFTGGTVANLRRHGFGGNVYPVNPRRCSVGGYEAYPNLGSLPGPIDLSVLLVRADSVVPMLEQSVAAGARAAIVVASGFGEGVGDEAGRKRALELDHFLQHTPIPILGPSTTGLVNVNDSFVPRAVTNHLDPSRLRAGSIALISQSGAANNAVFNRAQSHGVAVGLAVATGVQANVSIWDVARFALSDDRIKVLALLVEELGSPGEYEAVLRDAAESGKPVVMLRTGRSAVGKSAIATHTGSLAGNWAIEREMLRALGVALVSDLDQLWEVASIATHWGVPTTSRLRLGVIGLSGGEGAAIADYAEDAGIEMPPVSPEFAELVASKLQLAGAGNPFDPTGEAAGKLDNALAAMVGFVGRNDYDTHVLALNAQPGPAEGAMLNRMLEAMSTTGKRVAVTYWDIPGFSDGIIDVLADFPGPTLPGSSRMVKAIEAWSGMRALQPIEEIASGGQPRLRVDGPMDYWSARRALAGVGVPFADATLVHDQDAAVAAAEAIGYPVVLKANVPSTTHKAAAGLVRLGVETEESLVRQVAELFASASAEGVVVERAVLSTASLIVGTAFDEHIGAVVMAGSGGSAAEELADSAVCPVRLLTRRSASELLLRCAAGRFLADREPEHFTRVAELIQQLGHSVDGQRISVDLNPLVISPSGLFALDARIEQLEELV